MRLTSLVLLGGVLVFTGVACSSSDDAANADPNPDGKLDGQACTVGHDCKSGICTDNKCAPASGDGGETDVGCGGKSAPPCADGKSCKVGTDCQSGICTAGKCASPSPTDGIKNGGETDVDCGGTKAPKCAVGKGCAAHADCASDACSYEKKCVAYKGCTAHFGGDTCGAGETGEADAKHESCCTTIAVTDRPSGQGGPFTIDKYQVTAGRMRAFIERTKGDLKSWAATNPKGWDQSWTQQLPSNMDEALAELGPQNKRGCDVVNQGGRTYWQPPIAGDANEHSDFTQDVLDEKALNCVTWQMAMAVCVWDGGRLASASEIGWEFENRGRAQGATQYPWQFQDNASYDPNAQDPHVVHQYSYTTPNPPATMRTVPNNGDPYPLDHAFWMAPPGRRPTGANMHGVQDIAGNMMPWVKEGPSQFLFTLSWEKHPKKLSPISNWAHDFPQYPDGYYAIGVRCVHDQ